MSEAPLPAVEKAFVLGIRAVELTLGIVCDDNYATGVLNDRIALPAFEAALPIISKLSLKYGIDPHKSLVIADVIDSSGVLSVGHLQNHMGHGGRQRHCLSTQYACECLFVVLQAQLTMFAEVHEP
jgi:glucan endo-1,6-beta-glucosidase